MNGFDNNRNPWFAAAMSAVLPGFGQLYLGEVNRAIWFYLGFTLLAVPLMALIALHVPAPLMVPVLVLGVVLCLGVWMFAIVDAWRAARVNRTTHERRPWQTSGLYAVVFLVCNVLVLPLLIDWVRSHQVQAFKAESSSMTPSVLQGDYFFADMRYNCTGCRGQVARGDIAVFVYPDNRNRIYLKRIVGLPGDEVVMDAGGIAINGVHLSAAGSEGPVRQEGIDERSWSVQSIAGSSETFSTTVEPGHVFVLGDNRESSNDSRLFGSVPLSDVIGLARQVWFSRGEDGIRWERIGLRLQPG